jgi:hypothetical protein
MADIFISYAKTDRPLALKLAAMLGGSRLLQCKSIVRSFAKA